MNFPIIGTSRIACCALALIALPGAAVQGAELVSTTPREFTSYLQAQAQIAKWGKLVRESGMVNN